MARKYRIAIVGIGAIAGMHAQAIADLSHAELVAGSCRGEEKGRKFAREHGCTWYDDYERMLDEQKPDLITICTPSGAHLEPTQAAARRGIHVLCEKPLEITTQRVDQMIQDAEQGGIQLGGIFPQRFNPPVAAVHAAAKAGRFGSLATVNTYVPWWRDDAYYSPDRWQGTQRWDGGGALMNQSIHGVDMVQWLGGTALGLDPEVHPVEEVFAYTAKRGHDPDLIEVEDAAVVSLRFRGGALGQILAATSMYPGLLRRIQIGGRDGTAEVLQDQMIAFHFREERAEDQTTRQKFSGETATGGGASDPMAIDHAKHTRNLEDFLQGLEAGHPPSVEAREARKAVALIEAVYESARTGRPVAPR